MRTMETVRMSDIEFTHPKHNDRFGPWVLDVNNLVLVHDDSSPMMVGYEIPLHEINTQRPRCWTGYAKFFISGMVQ
jgi:hypothetical protein